MAAFVGMDVVEVKQLATTLNSQADSLQTIVNRIDSLVRNSAHVWNGKDAHDFAGWWGSEHRPRLVSAEAAVRGLGQSAKNNAEDQERVSGGQESAGPGSVSHSGVSALGPAAAAGAAATPAASRSVDQGPQGTQAYSVDDAIAKAKAEIGSSRTTGYDQQGECVKSVQRWINESGGKFGGGGVVSSYVNSGAVPVDTSQMGKGDVVQYTSLSSPDSWSGGVHTVMITGTNGDGTYQIVQSNSPAGSGLVTEVDRWTPKPPAGFEARVWRFGQH